ncbi:hypothetical protein TrVFT333_007183 [Trichoderma virens FT-333]|nr:hypothetical protein TrVFT333_007183 [Trichoderma virens FT-333]
MLKPSFILCLIPVVHAYTVFETNCSSPTTLTNFVSAPNTRGTLGILWSSLFTIFACTWTLQHPNVPNQRDNLDAQPLGKDGGMSARWTRAKWGLESFYRSSLRMLWTIIAPELIMTAASAELMDAHTNLKDMQAIASQDRPFCKHGGFVIRGTPTRNQQHHDPYHLNGTCVLMLRMEGHITRLPDLTEAEINDKSKGDVLVKLIALGQIVWATIHIIVRAVRRLPVSPLEVAVVAFAACAVFIYGLYWGKPQRVGIAHTIRLNNTSRSHGGAIPPEVYYGIRVEVPSRVFKTIYSGVLLGILGIESEAETLPGAPISIDTDNGAVGDPLRIGGIVAIGAAVFGGLHAIAWNFAFPSAVELTLWRFASVYTAAAPLCVVLLTIFASKRDSKLGERLPGAIGFILMFGYVLARLFILVEMFRTLFFLPPGSYISTWTSNIPHLE